MQNKMTKEMVEKNSFPVDLPEDYRFNLSDFALFMSVMKKEAVKMNILEIGIEKGIEQGIEQSRT